MLSITRLSRLYLSQTAGTFTPPLPPREEFGRMGVGTRSNAWHFSDINKDHAVRSPSPV